MRPPRQVYVYKDGEFVKHFNMLAQASDYTSESVPLIRRSLELNKPTKRGYLYSDNQLTQGEIKEIYKDLKPREEQNTEESHTKQEDDGFYLPKNKEARKQLLKQYIATKLQDHFIKLPINRARMERRFMRNLIDSL